MTDDQASARFGPFHRLWSPRTQNAETVRKQLESSEVCGAIPYQSDWPQVQAYSGHLPTGSAGIEFFTELAPDSASRRVEVRWSGARVRSDVRTEDGFAKIKCDIVRIEPSQVPL